MEVRINSESDEMLDRTWATGAGGVSLACALAAVVLLVVGAPNDGEEISSTMLWFAAGLGLAVGVGICGICLIQQRIWAQRALLVFWLTVTAGALLAGTSGMVWDRWWSETLVASVGSVWAWSAAIGAFVAGGLMTAALMIAARSRLRYASVVSLAVAAAIALTMIVNVISQRDYHRLAIESLGRYSISDRTENILAGLDEPVRLTCVYTGVSEGGKGSDFRPRVWELMEDLSDKARKMGKQIDIASITTDAERRSEDIRLGAKQRGRYGGPHEKFIRDFRASSALFTEQLRTRQAIWTGLADGSYLAQWPVPAPLAARLSRLAEGFDRTRIMLRSELDHKGIRNYPALTDPAKSILKSTLESLKSYRATVAAIEDVHRGAVKNRKQTLEAVNQSVRSIDALAAIVGKNSDPAPSDPGMVIKAFIQAAAKASEHTHKATIALETLAGPDHATLVVNSSHWVIKANNNKVPLSEFFGKMAKGILLLARRNQQIVQISTAKFKAEEVLRLRKQLATMQLEFALARTAAIKALNALVAPDAESKRIMQDASSDTLFAELISRAEALVKQADDLPKLEATSLTSDLAGDNIIIVEAGDKTEVVGFDEAWPLSVLLDSQGRPRRVFNGDSAIASRICSMTNGPFGTVVLAYVQPSPTSEMVKKNQLFASPTIQYRTMRTRLQAANFDVRDWELTKPFDQAFGAATTRPALKNVILIVLPSIGRAEIAKDKLTNLKRKIDSGTPALFLTESQIKTAGVTPHDVEVTRYLARGWGISVLSDFVVIPAVRDNVDPTRFKIDNLRNRHMPQSNFSSHVIGKGLGGQRLLWRALSTCPVAKIDPPNRPGITVTSLLTVPADQTATWATSRFFELQAQYRTTEGSFIRPNFTAEESPDIKPPFDLAVAVTREGDNTAKEQPNRIVVLGVGASLIDSYVDAKVEVHAANRTTSMTDPPKMDTDLVVNSVLWLAGLQDRIAAGPALSKPIDVQPSTRWLLMMACALGLPLLVLAAGGCVMLMRRRT
ncbi:MAG: hypothetical protein QGG42_16925 [Phycisphaerae bacterium]|jgi:hypothetical protein|nr:hypothetical protein [Phycisphaerae bacterium]